MLLVPKVSAALLEGFLFLHAPTDGRVFGLPSALGLPLRRVSGSLALFNGALCVPAPAALNIAMFLGWGAGHTLAAQPWFQESLWNACPKRLRELLFHTKDRVFSVATAAMMVPMLLFWQPADVGQDVLYKLPLPSLRDYRPFPNAVPWLDGENLVHDLISVGLAAVVFNTLVSSAMDELSIPTRVEQPGINTAAFAGGEKKLVSDGWHGVVRHPLYTLLLTAVLLTPRMTRTRLYTVAAFVLYLIPGVWMEERRLDEEFGGAYAEYRKKVPYQFVPYIW